jgi:hypothetical protein
LPRRRLQPQAQIFLPRREQSLLIRAAEQYILSFAVPTKNFSRRRFYHEGEKARSDLLANPKCFYSMAQSRGDFPPDRAPQRLGNKRFDPVLNFIL